MQLSIFLNVLHTTQKPMKQTKLFISYTPNETWCLLLRLLYSQQKSADPTPVRNAYPNKRDSSERGSPSPELKTKVVRHWTLQSADRPNKWRQKRKQKRKIDFADMNEYDQMTTTWLVRRGSCYKQFRAEFSGGERKRGRRRQMKRVDSF